MANRKISDLTALTAPASGDLLPIVDISEAAAANKNKKITIQSLFQGIPVNVGIGTTDIRQKLTFGTTTISQTATPDCIDLGATFSSAAGANMKILTYNDGTIKHGIGVSSASSDYLTASSGAHVFYRGTTEVARFDSSSRLLVGTSSARSVATQSSLFQIEGTSFATTGLSSCRNSNDVYSSYLHFGKTRGSTVGSNTIVSSGDDLGGLIFGGGDGTSVNSQAAYILCQVDGTPGVNDMPGRLVFFTTADGAASPTERMRITNGGYIKASNTGSYTDAGGGSRATNLQHFFRSDQNGLTVQATNTNTSSAVEGFTSDLATGATGNHFIGAINLVRVFIVAANGNVTNTNNSYGAISDIKLKENIVDAGSQWADLKTLQVRKYNFKDGQTHTQIGLIAQEVELVSPGLVSESPDLDTEGNELGTVTKSVNYSVLYMKAVKALQEAMERIEALETRLSAIEAA
jgi:hypothetical protein